MFSCCWSSHKNISCFYLSALVICTLTVASTSVLFQLPIELKMCSLSLILKLNFAKLSSRSSSTLFNLCRTHLDLVRYVFILENLLCAQIVSSRCSVLILFRILTGRFWMLTNPHAFPTTWVISSYLSQII